MSKVDFAKLQEQIDELRKRLDEKSSVQFVPVPYPVQQPCTRPHYPQYVPSWPSYPYSVPTIWSGTTTVTSDPYARMGSAGSMTGTLRDLS